ncbi:hypothetical protein HYR69_10755 [Candidatus Sumerlaeota bacterium]|nr:hypothetical protein [Candidatus Sumerlaeota bacterium]
MRDDFGYGWFRIAQSRAATGKRGEARKALLHAEFLATGNEKLRLRINKAMDSRQFAGFLKRFFSLR